jgi:hypothetical protein
MIFGDFFFGGGYLIFWKEKDPHKNREFVTEHSFFKIIYCKIAKIWHQKKRKITRRRRTSVLQLFDFLNNQITAKMG